jgi:LPXTG-motif cell wall-anchored protein
MMVLREELNWRTLAGGAMIMAGIGFIVVKKTKKEAAQLVTSA